MIGARKAPDVTGETGNELDDHARIAAADVVAGGSHHVVRFKRPGELCAERIAPTGGENDVGRADLPGTCGELPVPCSSADRRDALLQQFSTGRAGALQHQAVQYMAGEDGNRTVEFEADASAGGADELTFRNPVALHLGFAAERVTDKGRIGDAAAARFFPGELFVNQKDVASGAGQQRGGKCAGGSSANDRDQAGARHIEKSITPGGTAIPSRFTGRRSE